MSNRVVLVMEDGNQECKISDALPLPVTILGAELTADLTDVNANTSRLTTSATGIAPGTAAATTSLMIGGRYNATQKTLTDGQEASWAMSPRGAMYVTAGAEVLNVIQKGMGYSAKVDVTRPSNTNTYAAYDCVGAAAASMEFTNVGSAGEYLVTAVSLRFDLAAVPAGMTSFILHLFDSTPPNAYADEDTFDLGAADIPKYLGLIAIPTPVDYGSLLYIETSGLTKQVKLASSSLWGVLVTVGTYDGASAGTHTVTVHTRAV